jgi:hypothetical protein
MEHKVHYRIHKTPHLSLTKVLTATSKNYVISKVFVREAVNTRRVRCNGD